MHLSTIVFFSVLAFFTWRGYQKGFVQAITRILSWIVAYPAAIFFTPSFATWLSAKTALDGLIVFAVAGFAIFLVVSLLVTALLTLIAKLIPDNKITNFGSKIGGAGVGVFIGAVAGLIIVYILGIALAARPTIPAHAAQSDASAESSVQTTAPSPSANVPHLNDLEKARDSFIEASAKKIIGKAAATAVDLTVKDETTTRLTRAFVEDPHAMLTHVQQVSHDGELQKLMADEDIQSIMTTGDTQALIRNPAFKDLMDNPGVRALMAESDVNNEKGREAAAEKMITAWNKVQMIKHDPRVITIINDPEFQQQLNSPNKLPLMMNPKLNQLTQIIFSNETIPANGMLQYQDIDNDNAAKKDEGAEDMEKSQNKIYRWTDKDGQVHYSDKPLRN